MKRLRIIILIFFFAVAAFFGAYHLIDRFTSDKVAPVITAESDTLEVTIDATEADLLAGMSATDNIDGDVTDMLVVISKSKFIRKGTLRVNYAAFDQSSNVRTYSREVTYTDYVSPHFSLKAPLRFASSSSNHDFLGKLKAFDCLDGDISKKIRISYGDTVAVSDTITEQTVDIIVTNSYGDSSNLRLTVRFEDFESYNTQCPALSEYLIYTKVGEMPDLRSLITGIWSNGKSMDFEDSNSNLTADNVTIYNVLNGQPGIYHNAEEQPLDINTPGVYYVKYSLSNTTGEALGTTTLIVIVEE